MADDGVGVPRREQATQVGGIALNPADLAGDPGIGRPALERGEGIGTGIDHGDAVAASGERDGHAAGAAAEVHQVEGAPLPRYQLVELVRQQAQQVGLGNGATPTHFDHAAEDMTDTAGDRAYGVGAGHAASRPR